MPVRAGALALPRLTACAILSLEVFVVGNLPQESRYHTTCLILHLSSGAFARELQNRVMPMKLLLGSCKCG